MGDLIALNNISDPRKLPIGKVILIPESASPRPVAPKPAPVTPRYVPQRVEPDPVSSLPSAVEPAPTQTLQTLQPIDDDLLLDEDFIEAPVVPIIE